MACLWTKHVFQLVTSEIIYCEPLTFRDSIEKLWEHKTDLSTTLGDINNISVRPDFGRELRTVDCESKFLDLVVFAQSLNDCSYFTIWCSAYSPLCCMVTGSRCIVIDTHRQITSYPLDFWWKRFWTWLTELRYLVGVSEKWSHGSKQHSLCYGSAGFIIKIHRSTKMKFTRNGGESARLA